MKKYVIANWKMHGEPAQWRAWASAADTVQKDCRNAHVVLAVPSLAVGAVTDAVEHVSVAVQDVHACEQGAHTGCVSAPMAAACGVSYALVGHSERREEFSEDGTLINAKVKAAQNAGLSVVLCFGESGAERSSGAHLSAVVQQLEEALDGVKDISNILFAYEPVWAISTSAGSLGRAPEKSELEEMFSAIRQWVKNQYSVQAPVLYGGSVKAETVAEITAVFDGVLVGGASLDEVGFAQLIRNA